MNTSVDLPPLLSIEQVANATGLSDKTIRRRLKDGTIKGHRIGPRIIRIERDSVLALLARPIGPADAELIPEKPSEYELAWVALSAADDSTPAVTIRRALSDALGLSRSEQPLQ